MCACPEKDQVLYSYMYQFLCIDFKLVYHIISFYAKFKLSFQIIYTQIALICKL